MTDGRTLFSAELDGRWGGGDPTQPMLTGELCTVVDLIAERARQQPDAVALSRHGRNWSYRQLVTTAERCAAGLTTRRVRDGDVVAVDCGRSPIARPSGLSST